ncbi:MAG: hypothetical protein KDC34_11815 [Saprospiraceae bacterium]|nr:hypothetical protein [Saprospiraceae bacterium]
MKKYIAALIFLLSGMHLMQAQETFQPKTEVETLGKGVVYERETTFDLRMHTHGLSAGLNFGKLRTYYLTRFYHFELGELRHHKENRTSLDQTAGGSNVSRPFIYGKQNNFYALRVGIGEKRYFSEKAKRKGVAVGVSYEGGFSLGILKPYYLELYATENTGPFTSIISVKYSEDVAASFLNPWNIHGASTWFTGLNELNLLPGVQTQVAVHFDWGAFDEYAKAIEVGFMLDLYLKQVPIMVDLPDVENRPFFLNLFVNLQFGKRQ